MVQGREGWCYLSLVQLDEIEIGLVRIWLMRC